MAQVEKLERPEGAIAYEVEGSGPLIVALPGMGELRSSYRFTVPALVNAGFRVATMDLRGHGDSDATFSRYDDVAAGEDALALIKHLGGPATIIGNSMGAGAATWAAAEQPKAVTSLVLIGPFVRNAPVNPLMALLFKVAMSGPWATKMWIGYTPKLYGNQPEDFDSHLSEIAASMRLPGHAKAFRATTRTNHALAEARLSEIKAPVLVIMGEKDPDFPDPAAEASWIAEKLKADTVMVPGAGHYPQAENPDQVNTAIEAFLKRFSN